MATSFFARSVCIAFAVPILCLSLAVTAAGVDPAAPAASTAERDDTAAWKKLEEALAAFYALSPEVVTDSAVEAFYKGYFPKAGNLADELEAFLQAYPASPHADDAWGEWMNLLNAAASGLSERAEQLERVEREILADPKLSRDRRMTIRRNQLDRTPTVAERERLLRSLEREFSETDYLYELLAVAKLSDYPHSLELADELLKRTDEKSGTIHRDSVALQALLAKIGKPVELKFTALDGRTIDLKDYRGKVVMLDFWATWCPPCVVGVPEVDSVRKKFRGEGFEVIGLSYDTERATLQEFLQKNAVNWPQFFDVRGWDAPLIQSFGRPGPPAYWLIDRDGLLVDVNAQKDLTSRVKKLLAVPDKSGATGR